MAPTPSAAASRALQAGAPPTSLEEAYRACERLAKTHYENFPVASWLLPLEERRAFCAVYAFCRGVDDLGDEAATERRLALLDRWEEETRAAFQGTSSHPTFVALGDVIARYDLEAEPFLKLIEANRMDQRRSRYATYADLLYYCDHSANPVGRIVLALYDLRDSRRGKLSDAVCTALQLANFWQDVREDSSRRGRIYIPEEDMRHFGVREEAIARGEADERFAALMRFEVERARMLFDEGEPLVAEVPPSLSGEVRLFLRGGRAVLRAIERARYDVLRARPAVPRWRKIFWVAALWGRRRFLPGGFLANPRVSS
ncbi:MAG: squalene synthase HpnC [Acidobacteriota bacterium]|nr:MAG: squalene synthase HpnC [Acidobacteriota bacterium]